MTFVRFFYDFEQNFSSLSIQPFIKLFFPALRALPGIKTSLSQNMTKIIL